MVAPTPDIGEPTPGGIAIQPQVTELGREAQSFHNNWLLLLCAVISALVLVLLLWTLIRFNRKANPTPSRTSHNTAIEVVWTLVPVLILVGIAIPSISLLRKQYSPPPADLTVKVIGNQWYWTYQYPDNGGFEIVANMLKEKDQVKAGERFRTDEGCQDTADSSGEVKHKPDCATKNVIKVCSKSGAPPQGGEKK
jgi:cytochrome c oxidase subunit 2